MRVEFFVLAYFGIVFSTKWKELLKSLCITVRDFILWETLQKLNFEDVGLGKKCSFLNILGMNLFDMGCCKGFHFFLTFKEDRMCLKGNGCFVSFLILKDFPEKW